MILTIMWYLIFWRGASGIPASTIPRERVETKNAYINDCVIDEIGWIKNPTKLAKSLKYFYEETGCQPYIILREYDPTMNSAQKREAWSKNYYDTNFKENQNVVLYTYFCDQYDEGIGNDTLFVGTESSVVMDSEAQEIFWSYLDYDWDTWDTSDNEGMFADVFNSTAKRIMKVTTTSKDLVKYGIILAIVVVIVVGGIKFFIRYCKRKKEEAEETARILSAPIEKVKDSTDDLADKYTQ